MAPLKLTAGQVRRLRLRAQRLGPRARLGMAGPVEIVREVLAVQAQDPAAGELSIWARGAGLAEQAVARARGDEHTLIRTWALRSTLHLLAAGDAGWLIALLGPAFLPAGRARRLELGLDDETCERGIRLVREVLAGQGPLAREELGRRLAARGLKLEGQALPHLIGAAALRGLVCLGPDPAGNRSTVVLLEEWADPGPALPRAEALARLARRYLAAYGPSGPADLARCSGLPAGEARAAWQAIAAERVEAECDGSPLSLTEPQVEWLKEEDGSLPARLLPAFDTLLLGYRQRGWLAEPRFDRRINAGGGILHPTVLVAGRAAGTWKLQRRKSRLDILLAPFEPFPKDSLPGLEAEVQELGRFYDLPAGFIIAKE